MSREYIGYVGDACKNGMNAEEVQYLFNDIYRKSNTRQGKKILKLFAQGIGKAKKRVLMNKAVMNQSYQNEQHIEQKQQEKTYQYQYFKQ